MGRRTSLLSTRSADVPDKVLIARNNN